MQPVFQYSWCYMQSFYYLFNVNPFHYKWNFVYFLCFYECIQLRRDELPFGGGKCYIWCERVLCNIYTLDFREQTCRCCLYMRTFCWSARLLFIIVCINAFIIINFIMAPLNYRHIYKKNEIFVRAYVVHTSHYIAVLRRAGNIITPVIWFAPYYSFTYLYGNFLK